MKNTDMFRIAVHNPTAIRSILTTTPYRSPVRRAIEQELIHIVSDNPQYIATSIKNHKWGGYPCPALTVETFNTVLEKTNFIATKKLATAYPVHLLLKWWKYSFTTYTDAQAPVVYRILNRLMESRVPPSEFVIIFLSLLPETDTYDTAREILRTVFKKILAQRISSESKHYLLGIFQSANLAAQFPITGKNFRAVYLDDTLSRIIQSFPYPRNPFRRELLYTWLAFAIRTENEFLDAWKRAPQSWRAALATMHGKISAPLLDRLIKKYSGVEPILSALLTHPEIHPETLFLYALRGNKKAHELIKQRDKKYQKVIPKDILC